jgi:hypothetical protein
MWGGKQRQLFAAVFCYGLLPALPLFYPMVCGLDCAT